jgi:hypothetical protein
MKPILLFFLLIPTFFSTIIYLKDDIKRSFTINMENTINPLISEITDNACYLKDENYVHSGQSSILISKSEKYEHCISGYGNTLYARCYQADWEEEALFYTPTKDVPLNITGKTHSCISEEDVEIPYHDEILANAEIGVKYLVVDHSEKLKN